MDRKGLDGAASTHAPRKRCFQQLVQHTQILVTENGRSESPIASRALPREARPHPTIAEGLQRSKTRRRENWNHSQQTAFLDEIHDLVILHCRQVSRSASPPTPITRSSAQPTLNGLTRSPHKRYIKRMVHQQQRTTKNKRTMYAPAYTTGVVPHINWPFHMPC